jgi:tetratricopeptide (TPR) repeat protein
MIRKSIFNLTIAGVLAAGFVAQAKPLPAELVMGNGRAWKGQIVGRDGDWLEFKTGTSAKAIRIGASTVKELKFSVNIDAEKISEMMENREFETIIIQLSKAIKPFAEFSDIPSNLTVYNTVLMELYYRTQQYDDSLAISSKIADDDRDPELQEKSRMYQALALIDSGRSDEAEALLSKYGWNQDLTDDASPDKLYITAKLMALNKQYNKAMELVAKVIAFNSQDPDWMQPAELLCAEVYVELGMLDSAAEVCREILILYKNTPEFDKAEQLQLRIEKLRAEKMLEESLKAEEA